MSTKLSVRRGDRRPAARISRYFLRLRAMDPLLLSRRDERSVHLVLSGAHVGRSDPWDPYVAKHGRELDGAGRGACQRSQEAVDAPRSQPGVVGHARSRSRPAARAGDPRAPPRRGPQHGRPPERAVGRGRAPGVGRRDPARQAGALRGRRGDHRPGRGDGEADRRAARQPRAEVPQPRGGPARAREAGAELHLRADSRSKGGRSAPSASTCSSSRTATTTGP